MTTAHIEAQLIKGADGSPEFAVIPYAVYKELVGERDYSSYVPHDVVSRMIDGASASKAWREHLGLTQAQVAERMAITQAAYSQLETSTKLRASSRRKIAEAMGIASSQIV